MKTATLNFSRNLKAFCLLIFAFTATTLFAQTGSIKGRVIDAETVEPLPFASIFINNTTLGVAASPDGTFQVKGIPIGQREIIVSFLSYETYQVRIDVKNDQESTVDVKLAPIKQSLAEVEVKAKRDKVWERKLARFEKILLGTDERGLQCQIINPYVIDFNDSKEVLIATATEPIEIENKALGYKIFYYLKTFTSNDFNYVILGSARFQEMTPANTSQAVLWTKNRKAAYFGSPRHLFKSIINNSVTQEGFQLYVHRGGYKGNGSFSNELQKSIFPFNITPDMAARSSNGNEYKLSLGEKLEVHYINGPSLAPSYTDVGHSVSFLDMKRGSVNVTSEGIMLSPLDVVFSGDLSVARVSSLLPLDYKETSFVKLRSVKEVEVRHMYERVYLHTNKSFFYPSEIIWFKAYMNYAARGMVDSLSRVLYVNLIDSAKNVIQTKTLRIDAAGSASGDFHLPPLTKPGTYALVAYTNWMKNFGSSHYFVKPIPVLDVYDRIITKEQPSIAASTRDVEVKFNKDSYSTRELVNVSVSLTDEFERPLAGNLSVSVTDMNQVVVPTWTTENIVSNNAIPDEVRLLNSFTNRIERGVTWNGEFIPDSKKKVKADLTIVRGSFEEVNKVTTANDGKFMLTDLDIKDSVLFAFQALKKGEQYGKVVSRSRELPYFEFKPSSYTIPIERTNKVQRVLSIYENPADAILLEAIEVKGKKMETTATVDAPNPYGKADVILDNEELARYGMETLLRKKAPGYRLAFSGTHWFLIHLRGESTLMAGDHRLTEPVLVIDNILQMTNTDDPVGSRLMNMNVNTIARVEISSVSSSNVGAQGGYGVIAIFTKKASYVDKNQFQELYVKGFDTPGQFRAPDYSDTDEVHPISDARSTLYWNPFVIVNGEGHGEFSFYTSDMEGKYRLVIEGVTAAGKPVHIERNIEVKKR